MLKKSPNNNRLCEEEQSPISYTQIDWIFSRAKVSPSSRKLLGTASVIATGNRQLIRHTGAVGKLSLDLGTICDYF